jgi:demethylmenaquinone methyltransferase/2-methoxy-6-polyprenyl-1,4-benzoquinol methylase
MLRVLKPGGAAAILEFAEPPGRVFGAIYRFYFRNILPRLGGTISGDPAAYSYLPSSVNMFPPPEVLKSDLERAGFVEARFERWTGGIVTLHTAHKARSTLNLSFRA